MYIWSPALLYISWLRCQVHKAWVSFFTCRRHKQTIGFVLFKVGETRFLLITGVSCPLRVEGACCWNFLRICWFHPKIINSHHNMATGISQPKSYMATDSNWRLSFKTIDFGQLRNNLVMVLHLSTICQYQIIITSSRGVILFGIGTIIIGSPCKMCCWNKYVSSSIHYA